MSVAEPPDDDRPWGDVVPIGSGTHEKPKIPILTGAELAEPLPELEYLVREIGLVAGGGAPHLIAGFGFSGKTVAAQSLALSLASGSRIWGAYGGQRRRVLHVDMEQGERLTRRRYQRIALALGIDLPELGDDISVVVMPSLTLKPEHAIEWRDLMAGRDLVIIDSFRAATGGQDENSSEIRSGLDMLGQLSEYTKCRAMPIHHARKQGPDDPGGKYAIRGSGAIFDGADGVYMFTANKGEPVKVEHVKARSHGEPVEDFAIVVSDVEQDGDPKAGLRVQVHGVELVQEKRDASAAAARKARSARDSATIRACLTKRPGAAYMELRGLAGLSGDRLGAAIAYMADELDRRVEKRGGPSVRPSTCYYLNPDKTDKTD